MWWQNRDIASNINEVKRRIALACERAGRSPEEIKIVAVSKGVEAKRIEEAFSFGIKDVGESYVQEAREKIPLLSHLPITWHMVGHLQTNKAKLALSLFQFIHSVDSIRLAEILSKKAKFPIPILLEINISGEGTKFGFSPKEVDNALRIISQLPNLRVEGVMGIAPIVKDPEEARPFFRKLRELRDALGLKELSMGMTDDFEVAVEEGATILRLGRAIFGERRAK